MKEIELNALNCLIEVYSHYLNDGLSSKLVEEAKEAYDEYHPGSTLLDKEINLGVGRLFALAYPHANSGREMPSKKEFKKTLDKLKKMKAELEK